jgi:hypothetical protein
LFRVSLSDNLLQTILIPGLIVLIALGCATIPVFWMPTKSTISGFVDALNSFLAAHDPNHIGTGVLSTGILAVVVIVVYIFAMFFGLLLAVITGYVEQIVLDKWQARRLGLSKDEYQRQWQVYLDTLEKAHNSYITRQVTAFFFQARTAFALLLLALALCFDLWFFSSSFFVWVVLVVSTLLALFLLKAAKDDHFGLAEFRNRRFALRPDATAKPEDTLKALVDAWCQRRATRALQSVLPLMSGDRSQIPDPARACAELQNLMEFPNDEVSPAEKGMLYPTIAALSERARAR